jgi:hypothetical protein
MKINKNITVEPFFKDLKRQEAEIPGLLHAAQTTLGYFRAWFQSLQLPSTQSEIPLAPKSHMSFKVYVLNYEQKFHISIQINCVCASP